ncbi:class I SAM-dependent methyltransferase [Aureimonas populi]|uniref:Class I SAM-dependent methyltransferase n=1 Tax=Aureimonas populi TaxID=1701758 RepID=A0ABW5CMI0_9HYPH|nr:class I SAM-dependent methyltransferase [Aureimonas populi]
MTSTYVDDIAYVHTAHREASPVWLNAVLAALGQKAPRLEGLRICDLGCGTGFFSALTAAALPSSTVQGYDASARHIAHARDLAGEAGLANLTVEEADIRELAARPTLPQFDFVIVHGVLSWVSPQVREAIFRFIERALAPGGLAYLHYAAQPGAAVFGSVQKALSLAGTPGNRSDQRLSEGLALLEGMREGAGLFLAHPQAAASFDHLLSESPAFLAHEFMGPDWTPLHSADIMGRMEAAGCRFVGSASPEENVDALSLPAQTLPSIAKAATPALRETLKDIARDQSLRRDIYVRDPRPLEAGEHLAALRALSFRLQPGSPVAGPLVFATRAGPVDGGAATFDPLLARLSRGPAPFGELERLAPFAGRPGLLNQALAMLMFAGFAYPMAPDGDGRPAARFNEAVRTRLREGTLYPAFADAATGGPMPVSPSVPAP